MHFWNLNLGQDKLSIDWPAVLSVCFPFAFPCLDVFENKVLIRISTSFSIHYYNLVVNHLSSMIRQPGPLTKQEHHS
jgi:hypothetical protein